MTPPCARSPAAAGTGAGTGTRRSTTSTSKSPERQRQSRPRRIGEACFVDLYSDQGDASRLGALLALADIEAHALVLLERLEAAALDLRVVHEHVGATVLGGNEPEALFGVEPLHGAFCHLVSFYS